MENGNGEIGGLLNRYFTDQCDAAEVAQAKAWMNDPQNEEELEVHLKLIWASLPGDVPEDDFDAERLLDRIHHKINLSESGRHSVFELEKPRPWLGYLYRVAAILVIPLVLFNLYHYWNESAKVEQWQEISNAPGVINKFKLSDGTLVWLNSNSKIKFPTQFSGDERRVEIEGEAYFEVQHDDALPFRVNAGGVLVEDIGTKFNISAYPDEKVVETCLLEGKVSVEAKDKPGTKKILEVNQKAIYQTASGRMTVVKAKADDIAAWIENKLVLRDTRLDEAARMLSRRYNVDIVLKNKELAEYTCTATLRSENLKQVLALLKLATPINYTITEQQKKEGNEFTRAKVEISLSNKK